MVWLLTYLGFVVASLILAWFIAYVLNPAATRLASWGLPRTGGVVVLLLVFLVGALTFLLWAVPVLAQQLRQGLAALPGYLQAWGDRLGPTLGPLLTGNIPEESSRVLTGISRVLQQSLPELAQGVPGLLRRLFANAWQLVGFLLGLSFIPVFAFYLLLIFDRIYDRVVELFPPRRQAVVGRLLGRADEVLSSFVRGQLLVCLILGAVYSMGLTFTGIDMPWVVGSISGALFFVPYLGTLIGVLLGSLLALLKFHDLGHLLAVWGVFAAGQALEGFVLTPRIVGDRVGLNPVAVLVAILAGGRLFGAAGVLLAVPTAAVGRVALEEAWARYRRSDFYLHP